MPDGSIIIPFCLATLVLLLIPGPAVAYIVARSVDQGTSAGLVSVLGLGLGAFIQLLGVLLGISAVILASAAAFTVLKYLGAAYLVYLGIQRLRERDATESTINHKPTVNLKRIFIQGVIVDIRNPKTAIFPLAFFPQFIDPVQGAYLAQVLVLGALYVGLGLVMGSLYALLAGQAGLWFRGVAVVSPACHAMLPGAFISAWAWLQLSPVSGSSRSGRRKHLE